LAITEQHTEESLCLAHIYALAGVAGVNYGIHKVYDYGVDGQFNAVVTRGNRRVDSGFPLDFQAKATVDWELSDGHIVYDLEAKTYNDMAQRSEAETTLMLILLCLPNTRAQWHGATAHETIMRHCCYWHIILDGAQTSNTSKKRVFIPETQILTPDTLNQLLTAERIRRERQLA
jgi:Domain of unknown function (DUF4365)